jgi:hypothetical protein
MLDGSERFGLLSFLAQTIVCIAYDPDRRDSMKKRTERTFAVAGPKPPDDLMATMTDPWGRTVWLTKERWKHIIDGHKEVEGHMDALNQCVQTAEKRSKGHYPDAERLWVQNTGPSKWFCVVVRYEGRIGTVRTALAVKRGPRPGDLT